MTLAVAVPFPWPEYLNAIPGSVVRAATLIPGFRFQPAVIMAADSRWTYRTGIDYDDGGIKVAYLGSHALGMYAGNTRAGQLALGRLRHGIERRQAGRQRRPVDPRSVLRAVWKQCSHLGGTLQFCFAFFDANGNHHVFRFDSTEDFAPIEMDGVVTLGWSDECDFFRRRLNEELRARLSEERMQTHGISFSFEEWAIMAGILVREACEAQASGTVGGRPLIAVLTPAGVEGRSIHAADTRQDNPKFEQLTLTEEQIDKFYERQRQRGLPYTKRRSPKAPSSVSANS